MNNFAAQYDRQEQVRKEGTLKVLSASDLPVPPQTAIRGSVHGIRKVTSRASKAGKARNGKMIQVHHPKSWFEYTGVEPTTRWQFIPNNSKPKTLHQIVGTGSYPKVSSSRQRDGVSTVDRRMQFLNHGRRVDRSGPL